MNKECAIKYVGNDLKKSHSSDAGFDVKSGIDGTILPRAFSVFPVGTKVKIPDGFYGQLFPRSGMAAKGVTAVCGVIDSGYVGEIRVTLINHSNEWININAGDRIAQLVILPVPNFSTQKVETLPVTDRGQNGFGSTGR